MSQSAFFRFHRWLSICSALALSACAGYGGSDLVPGQSTRAEVVASMGVPAMSWKEPSGREQLAYPRGPAGTQTFMAFMAADGRLEKIEKVLDMEHFMLIEGGRSDMNEVLRLLGPVTPGNDVYFKARDERVWSWLFCDSFSQEAYFDVLFDATTGIVRTTYRRPNSLGWDGSAPGCGR
jgi:hypothetical protein